MNYFIKVPGEMISDVVSGALKDCDLKIYAYVVSKIGSKSCMYMPIKKNVDWIKCSRSYY